MQHTRLLTPFSYLCPIFCRRQLLDLACDKWPMVSDEGRQGMARMAAAAAWGLGNWESMEEYSCLILRDSYDGAFYRAVLAVHQDHFGQAHLVCVIDGFKGSNFQIVFRLLIDMYVCQVIQIFKSELFDIHIMHVS